MKRHSTLGSTIETVSSPVAAGNFAAVYDLVRTIGLDTYRAEHLITSTRLAFDTEYWISMKYRRENWALDTSSESGPFQVHRVPSAWKAGCGGEVSAFSNAPLLMVSKNDRERFITWHGVVSWEGPVVKNRWQDLLVHVKITRDASGYVEAWKDGVKLFRRDGKLHEAIDDCGKPFRDPTFNVGIYKWDWKAKSKQPSISSRRTLFLDNLRITQGPRP
jgi:hypothetical protein